jgi:hypothetical protein
MNDDEWFVEFCKVRKLVLAGTKNHHIKHSHAVNAEPDLLHLHQSWML